ncbi:MAG: sulfite exporter TauE/SafE family protein [Xanthobacteraceae bacterium]|nr:sulfite exporter TauE/SafE family protein [Xanthobacteraceae bacterium]MBX3548666.1 sulfite exporter TauE/SafE family protein [Xanthobacteraceae bacterium]MCW5678584.1 sulfite exporter TauE/SafE family protein [Xanthobacteraceae bacterium]
MIPTDPLFYVVGLTTVFIIAVGKGAFGGGLATLGVPLLSLVMPPIEAAIIVAPITVLTDVFAFGSYRLGNASKPDLRWFLPAMLMGLALGYFFFVLIDPRLVNIGIGVIAFVFAIDWFIRQRSKSDAVEHPLSPALAAGSGGAFGFTSFVAHSGGPILSAYLLYRGLNKTLYVGTSIVIYALVNILKLFPYLLLGAAKPAVLVHAALLAPVVPLGVWLGAHFHNRLDQRKLFFWCYAILLFASAKLLFDAVRALMA